MWTLFIIAMSFVLTLILEWQGNQTAKNAPQVEEEGSSYLANYEPSEYDGSYRKYRGDSYYNRRHDHERGPIFSPDRRHIWDGDRWVRHEDGFGGGLMIGLLLAAALYFFLH